MLPATLSHTLYTMETSMYIWEQLQVNIEPHPTCRYLLYDFSSFAGPCVHKLQAKMWSKARRVLQNFATFFTFHLLKHSSLAVSSTRCSNSNSEERKKERGGKTTQEWKFQHVPMYKWKGVLIPSPDHDLCNPLTLPAWTEAPAFHLSQQHLCMTPSDPAGGFSLNSDVFICCFSSVPPGCQVHQSGFYQLTVLFVMRADAAQMD